MKPLWKVKGFLTEHHGNCLTCKSFVRLRFRLGRCLCVSVSVCCVFLWWWTREGRRSRGESHWTIWLLIPAKVSLKIAETEQLYQARRMIGGIGNMLFSIYSHTWKWERSKGFIGEPLKHVITLRGQILVRRTDDDPPCSPCVRSKRPRVSRHHAHMCVNMCAWCRYTRSRFWIHTRRRFGRIHGVFQSVTPHHTAHTPQHKTQHNNKTTTHGDRDRKRQRQEDQRREKRRKEKREARQEKRQDEERERWKTKIFSKKCFKTLKPARWISSTCFEKDSLSDELFLLFSAKVQNLAVFWIIYMIRIRFFGPRELNQKGFSGAQCEGYLRFVLVEGTSAHFLLFCNLLFPTMVRRGDLDRHFSWRSCFHNDFFGSEAIYARCQPWWGSRGTWRKFQSTRSLTGQYRGMVATFLCSSFCIYGFPWSSCHRLCPCFLPGEWFFAG